MFTALVIAALIVAGAATAVGGVLVWASGRKELGGGEAPQLTAGTAGGGPGEERTLSAVRVGDVVQHGVTDYLVEGVLSYDEDGHEWVAARLVDDGAERWLLVGMERVGDAALRMCALDREVEISGYPPDFLTVDGARYKLDKRGAASVLAQGDTGVSLGEAARGSVLRCRWWRYEAPGQRCLVVEQWGGDFRVLRGTTVDAGDLELMQGS